MTYTILGIFDNHSDAKNAIDDLHVAGYSPQDLSLVMKDRGDGQTLANSTGANVAGGAVTGVATGVIIGGIAGLLIGIGAITIPGMGALFIAGPIAAALGLTGAAAVTASGAATGAVAGGLIGALMGLGLPKEDAAMYEDRVKAGGILLAVPVTENKTEEVEEMLRMNNADQVKAITQLQETEEIEEPQAVFQPEFTPVRSTRMAYAYAGIKGGKTKQKKPMHTKTAHKTKTAKKSRKRTV